MIKFHIHPFIQQNWNEGNILDQIKGIYQITVAYIILKVNYFMFPPDIRNEIRTYLLLPLILNMVLDVLSNGKWKKKRHMDWKGRNNSHSQIT